MRIITDVETGNTTYETVESSFGKGKAMARGPTCTYKGQELPCFIGCSGSFCITSEMLAAIFEQLDSRKLFDCTNGQKPFVLLDVHQSRLKVPFLKYIHDDNHPWTVCLGVPYRTHLWQVADASECNGSFKMTYYKAKREYIKHKIGKKVNRNFVQAISYLWQILPGPKALREQT
jgi:hypothetical protein